MEQILQSSVQILESVCVCIREIFPEVSEFIFNGFTVRIRKFGALEILVQDIKVRIFILKFLFGYSGYSLVRQEF